MSRQARVAVIAVLVIAALTTAWLVVPWSADSDGRTDRVIKVYGRQMGLSPDEAQEVREAALDTAAFICSIEADELEDRLRMTTTRIADAIEMAEAGCPEQAADFKATYPDAAP